MDNIDNIVSEANPNNQTKKLDKSEWVKKKQEERKSAFDLIEKTATEIVNDSGKFKTYLDVQSRMNKYSVGNALLITAQMPNATQLKEFSDWKEAGAFIKKNESSIIVLEPGESYTRNNGTQAIYYNPKKMFDVSQTTLTQNNKFNDYDDKVKLTAMLKDCHVNIKVVDEIPEMDRVAKWNKQDNILYVKRGCETKNIFKELSEELARATLEETENPSLDNFKCKCISYMLCKKYNIDVSTFNFDVIPDSLKNMNSNEIRSELATMRSAMEDINMRMSQHFENISKKAKTNDLER